MTLEMSMLPWYDLDDNTIGILIRMMYVHLGRNHVQTASISCSLPDQCLWYGENLKHILGLV